MKIFKNKYFYTFIIALGLLISCVNEEPVKDSVDEGTDVESDYVMMSLNINASDIAPGALTKERNKLNPILRETAPEDDGEKMNSLRIIVVRPNGVVEQNQFFDLTSPVMSFVVKMKVYKSESKKIYLIANEGTKNAEGGNLINYDFNTIAQNFAFPEAALNDLLMETHSNTEILPSPVPMTDCHIVFAPAKDFSANLFITRAVVKFTFKIVNKTSNPISLGNLEIFKIARKSFVFPRVTEYDAQNNIVKFDVPQVLNNDYYIYNINVGNSVPAANSYEIRKIYLLEGKFVDAQDARNYSMSLVVNDQKMSQYFPNLKQLPRNSHVLVTVTVNDAAANWEAEVIPFTGVDLSPEFGI